MSDTRMNFVIINPDEWRGDYAGCYGHPLVKTPNLDRLAAEGTRFDNCFVQHTVCSPSRCSFVTGWYPHVAGHRDLTHLLRTDEPNMFKYLRNAGYEVAWFGKNDMLSQASFRESVDFYDSYRGFLPPTIRNAFEFGEPGYYSFLYEPTPGTIDDHVDALEVAAGIEYLEKGRNLEKPFCLFLPLVTPHCPFTAPEPYHSMYSPDDVPPLRAPVEEGKPGFYRRIRETRALDRTSEETFRKLNAVYLGTITLIDELIGRVLDALDRLGLADTTTVLVYSDHGEWAGDFGLVEKWSSGLDDPLTRVPFVVRTPGGKAGHVVAEPVEMFDQMATVLELAGVKAQHTHFARSLVPQLRGAPGDPDRAVFAEGGKGMHEPHVFEANPTDSDWHETRDKGNIYYPKLALQHDEPETDTRCTMIRTMTHKLVRRAESGEHELYDLTADPQEMHNRYGDPAYAEVQRELETRMLDWYVRTSDVTPFDTDPRQMPPESRYWPRVRIGE
ncbi:MAG: sulfatase-like hydrolase/transferase [Spirochaetota bacterium]